MNYSTSTRQRFEAPRHVGVLSGERARGGEAGSTAAGTWVRFSVRLSAAAPATIEAARFLAFGCPHVIAIADWLAETAVGRAAEAVLPETVPALRERFALPVEKLGRLLIVEEAWIAALSSPYP